MDLKSEIIKVLEIDGHWVPSSYVAETLGVEDLLKVEMEMV